MGDTVGSNTVQEALPEGGKTERTKNIIYKCGNVLTQFSDERT